LVAIPPRKAGISREDRGRELSIDELKERFRGLQSRLEKQAFQVDSRVDSKLEKSGNMQRVAIPPRKAGISSISSHQTVEGSLPSFFASSFWLQSRLEKQAFQVTLLYGFHLFDVNLTRLQSRLEKQAFQVKS